MQCSALRTTTAALTLALLSVNDVSAQILGTFRWQLAPYCNTVTLTVETHASGFRLDGYDDLCGGPKRAPATGNAQFNPDGTISLALLIVRPDGFPVHQTATITPAALSGTWSDEYANGGTFAFNAPSPAPGSPRRVTLRGNYAARFYSTGGSVSAIGDISFGRAVAFIPNAGYVVQGGLPTPVCPGSAAAPTATPGYLCVYEQNRSNVTGGTVVFSGGIFPNVADPSGAVVIISAAGAGAGGVNGVWVLTLP